MDPNMSILEEIKAILETESGYGLHQLKCVQDPEGDCCCDSERDAGEELSDRVWALIHSMEQNAIPCAGGKWLRIFVPDKARQDKGGAMICREACRDVRHSVCRAHWRGLKPLPADAPALGPIEDARDIEPCEFCEDTCASDHAIDAPGGDD